MPRTAYSASQASRLAGVSIPTLKRMCAAGEIPYFRTPGGHLRIPADAVERLLGNAAATPAADPPSGLQDRRERERELGLRSQELRTRRGVARRVEPAEDEEKLTTQARLRELQRETDFKAAQLASQGTRRQAAQEFEMEDVRYRHGAFHRRWRSAAADSLPTWLSFEQHEKALEALDRVIAGCSEQDEGRMARVLREAIARLLAPWEKERQVAMRREQVLQSALWSLSGLASASEKVRATAAIRKALAALPLTVLDYEERSIAEEAVRAVNQEVNARLAAEKAQAERENAEREAQAKKAREEQQRAFEEQQRIWRKDNLVRRGVDNVWWYLLELKNDDQISEEEYEDIDQESLKSAVGRLLRLKITGDETDQDLEVLVEGIVADELDLESVEDESDEEE